MREDVRLGIEVEQRLQDALAAAHPGQPVMNDGDLHFRKLPAAQPEPDGVVGNSSSDQRALSLENPRGFVSDG